MTFGGVGEIQDRTANAGTVEGCDAVGRKVAAQQVGVSRVMVEPTRAGSSRALRFLRPGLN